MPTVKIITSFCLSSNDFVLLCWYFEPVIRETRLDTIILSCLRGYKLTAL